MQPMSYELLVRRYGREMAYDILVTIEKLAKIKSDLNGMDDEIRFKRALNALNV